jgi:acetyl esterase/lipase
MPFSSLCPVHLAGAGAALLVLATAAPGQQGQADLARHTNVAMRAMEARRWANALVAFDSAFVIRAHNYPLFYAAQAACQVNDTARAVGYFRRAVPELLTNPENRDFFASDTLARCLRTTEEWRAFDESMLRGFTAYRAREDAWVKGVNDPALRLDTLGTPGRFRTPPRTGHWTLQSVRVAGDTVSVPYFLYIPTRYDPARATPLLVFLHEAVGGRRNFGVRTEVARWDSVFTSEAERRGWILLWPLARQSLNWITHRRALEAVEQQIALVRRNYHVDSGRIYVGGNSDGGRGALYFALRQPTVAAATFHLASFPSLATLDVRPEESLLNTPAMFVLSGEEDALFPEERVGPLWAALRAGGADVRRTVVPGAGHDVARIGDHFRRLLDQVALVSRAAR